MVLFNFRLEILFDLYAGSLLYSNKYTIKVPIKKYSVFCILTPGRIGQNFQNVCQINENKKQRLKIQSLKVVEAHKTIDLRSSWKYYLRI